LSHKHVQLIIENHKIAITVYVNKIIVFTNRFHLQPYKELSVNQWVANGINTFVVNIAINPKFFEELKEQSLDMYINLLEGTYPDLSKIILKENHWKYSEDTQFPVNITSEVKIDLPYGNWSWYDGDDLSDENFDLLTLRNFLTSIHTALNNKDYEMLSPHLQTKASELAAAYGIPLNERLSDQKDFFENELFNTVGWGVLPMELDELVFRYHAGGRLIEVLNRKGKSPIQSLPMEDNVHFSIPLFLCHKNNQWILCR
jgi:hypothetical protein